MTVPAGPARASRAAVREAVDSAGRRLLGSQNEDGYWQAGQPTQVEITAEDLLFRHCAGLWDGGLAAATARWLRGQQCPAGGWPSRDGGPSDRCASVLAYCALRLAGDSPDAYHMAMAAGWIRDAGGLAAADVRARIWLAMLGEADWHELRIPPPEAIYLPEAHRVRIAGASGWGRPTVVPLTVLGALRPVRPLPFGLPELRVPVLGSSDFPARPVRTAGPDRLSPSGPARSAALSRCAARIVAGQQPDGSWRADGPGWLYSLLALQLLGTTFSHPARARGLAALDTAAVWAQAPAGPLRRLDLGGRAVQSTADAVLALSDAGLPAEHHSLAAAGRWLLGQELRARSGWLAGRRDPSNRADGSVGGMRAAASDTASVLQALRRVGRTPSAGQRLAVAFSIRWLASIQGRDGGWSGDADRGTAAAQLTGHVLAGLAAAGQPGSAAIRRAVVCLLRQQLPDGSWPSDPAADRLAATAAVLPALIAAGVRPEKEQLRRGVTWLARSQNPDGGWGSAADRPPGVPGSDPLPTAHALLALLAAGGDDAADAICHGVSWLTGVQLADGRLSVPVRALGRYLSAATSGVSVPAPRARQDERIPAVIDDLSG